MPAPASFPGSSVSDFALSADGLSILNVNSVNTPSVEHGGITYQPVVNTLTITVLGQALQIYVSTRTEISPGIVSCVENTSYTGLALDLTTGMPKLNWVQTSPPTNQHWTDVSPGVQIAEDLLIVIGAVVLIVLAVLTDGAVFVIAAIVASLLVGFAEATPQLIASITANAVGSDVPTVDALVMNATDTITWTGGAAFQITSASLNGGFQLGGNPGSDT